MGLHQLFCLGTKTSVKKAQRFQISDRFYYLFLLCIEYLCQVSDSERTYIATYDGR